jgi:nitric oxide dioxygenase
VAACLLRVRESVKRHDAPADRARPDPVHGFLTTRRRFRDPDESRDARNLWSDGMDSDDRACVRETLTRLSASGAPDMEAVYDRLFRIAPESKALFIGDMGAQMSRFWELIERVARDGVAAHAATLRQLGRRHLAAGVEAIDHTALCAALIETLSDSLGPDWTEAREIAWRRVYRATALAMDGVAARETVRAAMVD